MKVDRLIEVYLKNQDDFVAEYLIADFNLQKMLQNFKVPANDPLIYGGYKIKEKHKNLFLDFEFNFAKFEYFLACRQSETP